MLLQGPPLLTPLRIEQPLQQGLRRGGGALALADPGGSLTWQELDQASAALAHAYRARGAQRGDRLATLLPNQLELMVSYLACLRAGLVITALNYRYVAPELNHLLPLVSPALVLADPSRAPLLQQCPSLQEMQPPPLLVEPASGLRRLWKDTPPLAPEAGAPEEPALIYFTSGTTGRPKAVTHTRRSLGVMLASQEQVLGLDAADTLLVTSSMAHMAASMTGLAALTAGATLITPHSAGSQELLDLLRRHRPTVMAILPTALAALLRDPGRRTGDLASLRLVISGGDRVSPQLQQELRNAAGIPVHELYGMSELGVPAVTPAGMAPKPGSIGPACPGYALELRRPDGSPCAPGETGELWVAGEALMRGYWGDSAATAETLQEGWPNSGDAMRADADGWLWFEGRRKQMIIHRSGNICPQDVEDALESHPAVDLAGVIGVPDAENGENVCAYVTLRAGLAAPSEAELIAHAAALVGVRAPQEVRMLMTMPLNASGKVDRRALSQQHTRY